MFFVHKKTPGTMRLIIDARQTNMRFHSPPTVSLVTAEGFSMIEVEVDDVAEDDEDDTEIAEEAEEVAVLVALEEL